MIHIRSADEIALLRESGRLVGQAHQLVREKVKPGARGEDIDREIETFIRDNGARPAFKGHQGFPASICFSVNHQVVHGFPTRDPLKEGDVVSVDIGVEKDGYFGDSAWTYICGEDLQDASELLRVTEESLFKGIAKAVEGNHLFDVSHAVQNHVEGNGYSVVREMVGHGIGIQMHEEPQIPNYGPPGKGPLIKAGMVFAIEPMVNQGSHEIVILRDGWTAVTRDGSLSAHFEHCIVVTNGEPVLLTVP
ncbi:type I methionyl aminopeptidase [Gemmatimonadota bacterium]